MTQQAALLSEAVSLCLSKTEWDTFLYPFGKSSTFSLHFAHYNFCIYNLKSQSMKISLFLTHKFITTEAIMERGFHAEVYRTRLCVINILHILYILLCMAGGAPLTSGGFFLWSAMSMMYQPVSDLTWVSDKVEVATEFIDFLYPGTPSQVRLTSVHGCDSLWTPSAYPSPLLDKLQGWAALLWAQREQIH